MSTDTAKAAVASYAVNAANFTTRESYGTDEALGEAAWAAYLRAMGSPEVVARADDLPEGEVRQTGDAAFPTVTRHRGVVEARHETADGRTLYVRLDAEPAVVAGVRGIPAAMRGRATFTAARAAERAVAHVRGGGTDLAEVLAPAMAEAAQIYRDLHALGYGITAGLQRNLRALGCDVPDVPEPRAERHEIRLELEWSREVCRTNGGALLAGQFHDVLVWPDLPGGARAVVDVATEGPDDGCRWALTVRASGHPVDPWADMEHPRLGEIRLKAGTRVEALQEAGHLLVVGLL